MSFHLSVAGHVVAATEGEAKRLEEELVDEVRALLNKSKFRPHVTAGTFAGSHVVATVAPVPPVAEQVEAAPVDGDVDPAAEGESASSTVSEPAEGTVADVSSVASAPADEAPGAVAAHAEASDTSVPTETSSPSA